MKKLFKFPGSFAAAALCGAILIAAGCQSGAAPGGASPRLRQGAYVGEAKGFGGVLQVHVEVTENAIAKVTVGANRETDSVGTLSFAYLEKSIVENQSLADTVSGATFSSMAVKAAVEDALKKAGAQDDMLRRLRAAPIPAGPAPRDTETGIVVVGAGEAGMVAAMSAHDAGARVILIEKTGVYGGSTALSAGAVWFVDTTPDLGGRVTRYTADYIYRLFSTTNGPVYNKPVLDAIVSGTAEYGPYLRNSGYVFGGGGGLRGNGITKQLYALIQRRGIDLRFRSPAVELLKDGSGAVTGVKVQTGAGSYNIRAGKVILATGGFSWDNAMLDQYAPNAQRQYTQTVAAVGHTGDGHKWGLAAGGELIGDGVLALTGASNKPGSEFLSFIIPMSFLVNKEGKKFVQGDEYYVVQQQEIIRQTDGKAYIILGSDGLTLEQVSTLDELIAEGHVFKDDTLAGLAGKIGVDAAALESTVTRHNNDRDAGRPDEFNTPNAQMHPVRTPPYYGFRRSPLIMGTIAGLRVNTKMQVVNSNAQPIPNLYAAGELIFGNIFNGRYPTSGTANTTAMSSGRIAGLDAAAGIK
jgi:fumarate reductase flavoprotein subunit